MADDYDAVLAYGRALLEQDEPIAPEAVAELSARVRRSPPRTPEERDELLVVMRAVLSQSRDQLKSIGLQLRKLKVGRKALRGYGHLKSARRAQSANRIA